MAKTVTFDGDAFRIDGLRAFAKALKALGDEYPKALKQANFNLAQQIAVRAKARAGSVGGVAPRAAMSLRASRSANAAAVTGGGPRYPYFWGAEFGSKQYRQFRAWRGNQWGGWAGGPGYFLHPTIRAEARALIDAYMVELDALTDRAFPD